MKLLFEKQLQTQTVVTEEMLEKMKLKTYHNGDKIEIGDKILFAFLTDVSEESIKKLMKEEIDSPPMEKSSEPHEIVFKLISLNEKHFDLYTYDKGFQDMTEGRLPIIRMK